MNTKPIYTIETDCKDCYKCVRNCPSKAIKITEEKASIIDELCIYCGKCVSICPAKAKQIRNGISRVKQLIKSDYDTVVSLAPSFRAEFSDFSENEFINHLIKLGFNYISETALGAQVVTEHTEQFLKARKNGVYISSACPGVVELIKKYYPELIMKMTPFLSPMLAHAKALKKESGKDSKVIFIGPCIAKKAEGDNHPGLIDTAITFSELREWMNEEEYKNNIIPKNDHTELQFFPHKANEGNIYPIEGGMIGTFTSDQANLLKLSFSGYNTIKDVLDSISTIHHNGPVYLELLLCEGGCISGPGCQSDPNPVQKKIDILKSIRNTTNLNQTVDNHLNIECDFFGYSPIKKTDYSPVKIQEALENIGKTNPKDELNCGSCGYNTCREFAVATLSGMAESNMCVSHLRKVAHNQATILLKKIPSGVILINDQLQIVEMNQSCAKMLDTEIHSSYDLSNGYKGICIDELGYFTDNFKTAIHTGKEYNHIPIKQNGQNFQLSIFNIQKHKLVAGIIQNFHSKEFKDEIIEKRTREVIKKNMETVQKIAALLGDNASFTDSLLNSILTDYSNTNKNAEQ